MRKVTHKNIDTWSKVAGIVGVVGTLFYSAYQYSGNTEKEYKKPFWEAQLKSCLEVASVSSKIAGQAADRNSEKFLDTDIDKLFSLYYGTARLTLDGKTLNALGELGMHAVNCNRGGLDKGACIQPVFNDKSTLVTELCRNMLSTSWDISLDKLNSELLWPSLTE